MRFNEVDRCVWIHILDLTDYIRNNFCDLAGKTGKICRLPVCFNGIIDKQSGIVHGMKSTRCTRVHGLQRYSIYKSSDVFKPGCK